MEFPASEACAAAVSASVSSSRPVTRSRTRGEPANGVMPPSPPVTGASSTVQFALPMPLPPTATPAAGLAGLPLPLPPGGYQAPPMPPPAISGQTTRRSPMHQPLHAPAMLTSDFDEFEDKRKARLEKNRKSAQLSRQRKKRKFEELEFSVAQSKNDKAQLINELTSSEEEIAFLRSIISQCRECSAEVSRSAFSSTRFANNALPPSSSSRSREPSRRRVHFHAGGDRGRDSRDRVSLGNSPKLKLEHSSRGVRKESRMMRDHVDSPATPDGPDLDHGGSSSSSHALPPPPGAGPPPLSLGGNSSGPPSTSPGAPFHRSSFRSGIDKLHHRGRHHGRSRSHSPSDSRSPSPRSSRRAAHSFSRHNGVRNSAADEHYGASPVDRRRFTRTTTFYKRGADDDRSSSSRSRGRGGRRTAAQSSSRSRSRSPRGGYRGAPNHRNGYSRPRRSTSRYHHAPPMPPPPASLAQLLPSPDNDVLPPTTTSHTHTNTRVPSNENDVKSDGENSTKIKTEFPVARGEVSSAKAEVPVKREADSSSGSSPLLSPSSPIAKVLPPRLTKVTPPPPAGMPSPSSDARAKKRRKLDEKDIAQAAVLLSFKNGKTA